MRPVPPDLQGDGCAESARRLSLGVRRSCRWRILVVPLVGEGSGLNTHPCRGSRGCSPSSECPQARALRGPGKALPLAPPGLLPPLRGAVTPITPATTLFRIGPRSQVPGASTAGELHGDPVRPSRRGWHGVSSPRGLAPEGPGTSLDSTLLFRT